jgi:hypothetical protein
MKGYKNVKTLEKYLNNQILVLVLLAQGCCIVEKHHTAYAQPMLVTQCCKLLEIPVIYEDSKPLDSFDYQRRVFQADTVSETRILIYQESINQKFDKFFTICINASNVAITKYDNRIDTLQHLHIDDVIRLRVLNQINGFNGGSYILNCHLNSTHRRRVIVLVKNKFNTYITLETDIISNDDALCLDVSKIKNILSLIDLTLKLSPN